MTTPVSRSEKAQGKNVPLASSHGLSKVLCSALLALQPVVFYWHVLVNPQAHIPYDIEGFHLPLIAYVARCVRSGIMPLWYPEVMCGMPIHADLQAQVFYPFTWLAIWMGNLSQGHNLFYWVEVLVPLHMVLAGFFAYRLLRRMGSSAPAALLGASAYQLGGFFASQAQHLCAICTGAWLPLAILCVWELRAQVRWRWIAILALAVAMTVLSGFAATAAVVGLAVVLFVAALLIAREATWHLLPGVALGCCAGAAIAAVEIIPLWTLTQNSIASLRADWAVSGGGLPLQSLVSLVLPDYYHIFEVPSSQYTQPYNFTFLYVYCGIATTILLVAALFTRRTRPIVFLILTVIFALWMLGEHTPVYRSIYPQLPRLVRGALYSEYALMGFCFFAALTAAVTLDKLGRRHPAALLWCIALLTSADLIHNGANRPMNSNRGGYRGTDDKVLNEKVAGRLHDLSARAYPPSRIDYIDNSFSTGIYGPGMIGVPTPASNSPFLLLRLWKIRELFATGHPWTRDYFVTRYGSPLLRMLNVGALVGFDPIPAQAVAQAALTPSNVADPYRVYLTRDRLPRFYLVPRIRNSPNLNDTLRLLSRDSYDPSQEAVVEGIGQDRDGLASASVRVESYETNRVQLTVGLDRAGYLASSETMYPGWYATVNGTRRPMYVTNGAFRGLMLPAGNNRIVMEYHPRDLAVSMWLSIISCLVTVTVGLLSERRPRKATTAIAEVSRAAWRGSLAVLDKCVALAVLKRSAIASGSLILLTVALFYWKFLLTSRFSLLTGTEAVNRSYAWLQFCIFNIRHGMQPLWDAYTHGGHGYNGEIGAFYPLHALLALAPLTRDGLFSPHLYHLWFVFVHFLGACFMFALARDLSFGRLPALVASLCFSLGGFIGGTASLSLLESGIWLPLIVLFLLRAVRGEDFQAAVWNAVMSGGALGMSILAGGRDMVTLQVIAIVSAGFVCAKSRARAAMSIAVVLSAGLAAGSIQWLPALANGPGFSAISNGALSPHNIVAMLIPDAFQRTAAHGEAVSPYMGVFPLLLAIIGIRKQSRDLRVRYFAWLAGAAFLLGLGPLSLFHGALSTLLPGLWVQDASRMAYLIGFAGSLLAAFGAGSLLSGTDEKERWSGLNHIFLAVLGICGVGLLLMAVGGRRQLDPGISASVVLIFLSYGVFRYVVSTRLAGRALGGRANALVVALVLFDLHAFDRLPKDKQEVGATTTDQLERLLSFRGAAQFLKHQPGPPRVQIAAEPSLNFGAAFGIETVDTEEARSDLFNTRYRARPASAQEEGPVYQDAFWKIYEIPAYPRAWMVHQAVFEASRERQLALLNTAGFDPWRTAPVAGHVRMEPALSGAGDAVSYFKSEGDRTHIEVDVRSRGLLVLSQRFQPGWRATVNGSAAPIYRVDGDLSGIVLDRGYHRIVLEYRPWPLYLAWVVSAGTLFALIFRGRVLWRDLLRGSADPYAGNWKEHYRNAWARLKVKLRPLKPSWPEGLLFALCAGICCFQILIPPYIGLANNGDFAKVYGRFACSPPDGEARKFRYFVPDYEFGPQYEWRSDFKTSEIALAAIPISLVKAVGKHVFNIRWVGALHLVIFLCAYYALLLYLRRFGLVCQLAIGGLALWIFTDVTYVAYFNSFFSDTPAMLGLLLMVPLALHLTTQQAPRTAAIWLFTFAALLFITSKTQHALWGIYPVAFIVCFGQYRSSRANRIACPTATQRGAVAVRSAPHILAAAAVLMVAELFMLLSTPPTYSAQPLFSMIFFKLAPNSPSPQAAVREFGLGEPEYRYIGTHVYTAGNSLSAEWLTNFNRRTGYGKLVHYWLRHPAEVLHSLRNDLVYHARDLRPNGSNFRQEDGHAPLAHTDHFASWSNLRSALYRRWPGHILLWYAVVIAGAILEFVRRTGRGPSAICLGICAMAILEFCFASLTDANETERHLFLFHVMTEITICFAAAWILDAVRRVWLWRYSVNSPS